MKSLLNFSILVDYQDRNTEVRVVGKLFAEDDEYVWHLEGINGDVIEALPTPKTLAQAKTDVVAAYGSKCWDLRASWI